MRAIAHGWTPSRAKSPPSRAVAQEFVDADRKYSGGFAENRYWVGGLAAMDKVNAGFQGSLDNPFREFEEGGEVVSREDLQEARALADARLGNYKAARFTLGKDHSATQNLKASWMEAKEKAIDMANRVGAGAGGGGGAGYQRGGRARRKIGRVMPLDGGEQYTSTTYKPRPVVTASTPRGRIGGVAGQPTRYAPPATVAPATTSSGPRITAGARSGRRGTGRRGRGGRRNGGGGDGRPGGVGGSGTTPRTIIPTNPASYVGGAAGASSGASPYREELRQHQAKIAATLGSARGGHVTGYAEGGTTRADNPFDPVQQKYQWRSWERKYGRDPDAPEPEAAPPPEPEAVAEEEDGGIAQWLRDIFTPDPEGAIGSGESRGTIEEQMEAEGQAYGGRVRYQAGGLATAAPGRILPPAGGVPPWIEPVGSGPGFMEPEPEGYQFGGMAARMGPAMRMARGMRGRQQGGGGQYRGVPPQRGGIQRGAPPGGGRGFMGMANRARQQYGAGQNVPGMSRYLQMNRGPGQSTRMNIPPGGTPQGALAQMYGRAQQQQPGAGGWREAIERGRQQPGGGGQQGFMSRLRQMVEQQRGQQPGGGGLPPGYRDPMAGGRGGQYGYEGDPSQPGYDDRSYEEFAAQQRQQGNVSGLPDITDEVIRSRYEGRNANQGAIYTSGPGAPGGGGVAPGNVGTLGGPGYGEYPLGSAGPRMDPSDPRYRAAPPPGSTFAPGEMTPGGGNIPPWKQPGRRIAPPPGKFPRGEVTIPGGEMPGGPGSVIGGPRVPPNMQGYLQKQRMMNRPPANVGGGANRVGMADQQGAMARAMQRGTGRAPPSRRFGRGRAGRGRGFQQQ